MLLAGFRLELSFDQKVHNDCLIVAEHMAVVASLVAEDEGQKKYFGSVLHRAYIRRRSSQCEVQAYCVDVLYRRFKDLLTKVMPRSF